MLSQGGHEMNSLKPNALVLAAGALALGAAPLAQADYGYASNVAGNVEFARVLDVQPLMRTVMVQVPVRECVEVPGYSTPVQPRGGQGTAGTTIAGGVIGGLVGNNFGGGNGKDAMRILGAVVGAAVGNDIARERNAARPVSYTQVQPVTQCTTRQVSRQEERFDGYHVTYEFNGRRYSTQTREHPGSLIPVHVSVQPAF